MNTKSVSKQSNLDKLKWLMVVIIIGAGVYGNSYFAEHSFLLRLGGLVLLGVIAVFVALQTAKGQAFWTLMKEARVEIRKVVWPTRQETIQTTLIVIVVVLIAAAILWGFDSLLSWIISSIIG